MKKKEIKIEDEIRKNRSIDRSAMSSELSKMQEEGLLTFLRHAFELKI